MKYLKEHSSNAIEVLKKIQHSLRGKKNIEGLSSVEEEWMYEINTILRQQNPISKLELHELLDEIKDILVKDENLSQEEIELYQMFEDVITLKNRRNNLQKVFDDIEEISNAMMSMDFTKRLSMLSAPISDKNLLNYLALVFNMINEELELKAISKNTTQNIISVLSNAEVLFVTNNDGLIHFVSRFTENLFGLKKNELQNTPIKSLLPNYENICKKLLLEGVIKNMDVVLAPFGTKKVWTSAKLNACISCDENGTTENIIYQIKESGIDGLTDPKFEITRLSHDLKTPLNTITTILNTVKKNHDEISEYLDLTSKNTDKLSCMVGDLINSINADSSDGAPIEKVDFKELFNELISSLKHIEGFDMVDFKVDNQQQKAFYNNRAAIYSIIQNLSTNALKYRSKEAVSYISLLVQDIPLGVQLQIQDNGVGISQKDLKRITDKGYQVKPESEGKGLGLYLVQEIVKKLNGKLEIRSKSGEGSTFTIEIPDKTNIYWEQS